MDDIVLRSVQSQFKNGRNSLGGNCDVHRVITDKGEVLVAVQGNTLKPAILTYHDLGLNCMLKFYFLSLMLTLCIHFQMQQILLDFSTIPLRDQYWKIFAFIMSVHQDKKRVHQVYPKSMCFNLLDPLFV